MKDEYINKILMHVKNPFVKEKIKKELLNHLEEKEDYYMSKNFNQTEAQEKAIEAMGDPETIGQELNEVHKPYISYLIIASRVLLIAAIISISLSLYPLIIDFKDSYFNDKNDEKHTQNLLVENYDKIISLQQTFHFKKDIYIVDQIAYNLDNDDIAFVIKEKRRMIPKPFDDFDLKYSFNLDCEDTKCDLLNMSNKQRLINVQNGKDKQYINFSIDSGLHKETYQLNLEGIKYE